MNKAVTSRVNDMLSSAAGSTTAPTFFISCGRLGSPTVAAREAIGTAWCRCCCDLIQQG